VEQGVRSLPDDFLTYYQGAFSQYRGMRGPVLETEEFLLAATCARGLLQRF